MRDVNLTSWKPAPHYTYFGHVSSSPEANAVGFVVIRVDNGRLPCCGVDSDLTDNYFGDVLRDDAGNPYPGVVVQYFREAEPSVCIHETRTDEEGRHQLWVPPGRYSYHFVNRLGNASERKKVDVVAGRMVRWESVGAEGEILSEAREFALLMEDQVCEWSTSDGQMFSWADVEGTIARVCERAPFRYVTFDKLFCKPDMIVALQARGVPAWPGELSDLQVAGAYRNALAMGNAGCLFFSDHRNANYQYARCAKYANERRVTANPGEQKYLADARACAVHFAAQMAGAEQPQADVIRNKTGLVFRDSGQAVQQVVDLFRPKPEGRPTPQMEYVLLGQDKKR